MRTKKSKSYFLNELTIKVICPTCGAGQYQFCWINKEKKYTTISWGRWHNSEEAIIRSPLLPGFGREPFNHKKRIMLAKHQEFIDILAG